MTIAGGSRRLDADFLQVAAAGLMIASTWLCIVPAFCIPVAFAPLIGVWTRARTLLRVAAAGWFAQFVAILIAFSWIPQSVHARFELPWPMSILALVVFAAVADLHVPVIGMVWHALTRALRLSRLYSLLLLPPLWALTTHLVPRIFPFHYGYPWLWSGLPIYQLADVVGFAGLAFVTILVNCLAAGWLTSLGDHGRGALAYAAVGVALLLALSALGRSRPHAWMQGDRSLRVEVIQTRFEHGDDRDLDSIRRWSLPASRLLDFGDTHPDTIDVAVWPESTLPLWVGHPRSKRTFERLSASIARRGVPVIAGALGGGAEQRRYNSAIAISASGALAGIHHKEMLFPFGEYVPGSSLISSLERFNDFDRPGEQPASLDLDGVRYGLTICFEGLYPHIFERSADAGAQVFINLSSDGAFESALEAHQHLYMVMARSIEFRRPLIRASKSGISTAILATGDILGLSPLGVRWRSVLHVPYLESPPASVYQRHRTMLPIVWCGLTLIIAGLGSRSARRRAHAVSSQVRSDTIRRSPESGCPGCINTAQTGRKTA
jgi:apolipoprotein N-acyltransferase